MTEQQTAEKQNEKQGSVTSTRSSSLGLGLVFFLTLPEGNKLACSCCMGAGRRLENPESETKDFVTRHSRNIPFSSPPPLPKAHIGAGGTGGLCPSSGARAGGGGAGGDLALLL